MYKARYFVFLLLVFVTSIVYGCDDIVPKTYADTIYRMSLEYSEDVLVGEETITYTYTYDSPQSKLCLMLLPNAYKDTTIYRDSESTTYYDNNRTGGISISSVTIDGDSRQYTIDDTTLSIPLDSDIYKGDTMSIYIKYSVTLPHANTRLGITEHTVNLSNFYPQMCIVRDNNWANDRYVAIGDPYVSDIADYYVDMTLPSDYIVAVGGRKSENVEGESKKVSVFADNIRDFAMCLSREFSSVSAVSGGTMITYYYYNDPLFTKTLSYAQKSMTYFSNTFATYPYIDYTVVQTRLNSAGMEYGGIVYISDTVDTDEIEEVVVHETAHQWWYGIVGNDNVKDAWIDEGLAEYTTLMYLADVYGTEYRAEQIHLRQNAYVLYVDVFSQLKGECNTSMCRSIYDFRGEFEYTYMCYIKPTIMWSIVHDNLGNKFVDGLKLLIKRNTYGRVNREELIYCIEEGSGKHIEMVVDSWVDGKVLLLPLERYMSLS